MEVQNIYSHACIWLAIGLILIGKMLVAVHILGAVASLPLMAAALAVEMLGRDGAKTLLKFSAVSFAGLIASGTGLVIIDHTKLLGVCTSGLLYLAGLSVLYVAYKNLPSRKKSTSHNHG